MVRSTCNDLARSVVGGEDGGRLSSLHSRGVGEHWSSNVPQCSHRQRNAGLSESDMANSFADPTDCNVLSFLAEKSALPLLLVQKQFAKSVSTPRKKVMCGPDTSRCTIV